MTIFVASCDKNADLFEPFHHCIEKYWAKHPKVVYCTESVHNPYYKTICHDYSLEQWTRRIRESLEEVKDDLVLFMVDDIFIRNKVDEKRIKYISGLFGGSLALVNLEKEWDDNEDIGLDRLKRRTKGKMFRISLMCGVWDRKKLIDILEGDHDPWYVENSQPCKDYEYYINSGDYIIDWGYKTFCEVGVFKGKWCREVVPFFEAEGIQIDYEKRGFN